MAKLVKNPNDFDDVIINGCLIKANTKYEIVHRKPVIGAVPDEYLELGSYKERSYGVGNYISLCQYNTGFNTDSENFNDDIEAKNDWNVRAKKAKKYYDIFAEPLRIYIPDIERVKISADDEFFDRMYENGIDYFRVDITEGLVLDTANPIDRFKLYIAIIENQLVMKGKRTKEEEQLGMRNENDPKKINAQFAYVSIEDRKEKETADAYNKVKLVFDFTTMLTNNRDLLIDILKYINIPVSDKSTNSELSVVYMNYIDGKLDKEDAFRRIIDRYEENPDQLKREFEILRIVGTKAGREALVKEGSAYFLGSTPLGSNYKSVAKKLAEDEDLYSEFKFKIGE